MKKIILLTLTALMVVGCCEYYPNPSKSYEKYVTATYIDSCEYLRTQINTFTHKGNCRFCKERRQKELKELVEQIKEK